jgi:hypothetical protein
MNVHILRLKAKSLQVQAEPDGSLQVALRNLEDDEVISMVAKLSSYLDRRARKQGEDARKSTLP